MKTKVVYFEGLPGSGKTTIIKKLVELYPSEYDYIPEFILDGGEEAHLSQLQDYFVQNDLAKYLSARRSKKEILLS